MSLASEQNILSQTKHHSTSQICFNHHSLRQSRGYYFAVVAPVYLCCLANLLTLTKFCSLTKTVFVLVSNRPFYFPSDKWYIVCASKWRIRVRWQSKATMHKITLRNLEIKLFLKMKQSFHYNRQCSYTWLMIKIIVPWTNELFFRSSTRTILFSANHCIHKVITTGLFVLFFFLQALFVHFFLLQAIHGNKIN